MSAADLEDPDEGRGDETAYDGQAVAHLDSEAGRAELAERMPEPEHDEVDP